MTKDTAEGSWYWTSNVSTGSWIFGRLLMRLFRWTSSSMTWQKEKKKIEINLKVNFTTLDSTHHPQTTRQAYYKQTRPEFPDYLTSKKIAAIIYCIILILLLTCLKSLVRQSFKKSQTTSQYINRSVRKKMVTEDDQFFLYSWLVSSKLSLAWKSALLLYLAAVE